MTGQRLAFIEGMRGVAAFYVVLQHICTMVDPGRVVTGQSILPVWLARSTGPFLYGHLAVSAFIVISGFCLQLSLYNKGGDGRIAHLGRFMRRRCERILPPYYACLVISLVVALTVTSWLYKENPGLPWSQYLPVTTENTVAHFLMVHNLLPEWMYKINGVLWSISIEFQLYFLFPLLVLWLWRFRSVAMLAPLALVAWLLILAGGQKLYVWYLPLFGLGMAAAFWARDPRIERRVSQPVLFLLIGASLAATLCSLFWTKDIWIRDSLFAVTVCAVLMSGTFDPRAVAARLFGLRPLVWIGGFSYSLYLMHHPLLQVAYYFRPDVAGTPTRQIAYLGLMLPAIVLVIYGFYWVFERPFIKTRPPLSGH